jgi:hypothetical protein
MSSLRNFLGSKRKQSSNSTPTQSTPPPTAQAQSPRPTSIASSSSTSLPTGAPTPTGNMNPNNPQGLGRPPSYTYSNQQLNPGQPPQGQRPHSPLPPINTATAPQPGYPPQQIYQGQPQGPPPGPPGYAQQPYGAPGYQQTPPQPPVGPQSYNRPGAVEVEAAGRSKAQLIVGIDFVGGCSPSAIYTS